jgi:hypothetical protein
MREKETKTLHPENSFQFLLINRFRIGAKEFQSSRLVNGQYK